MLYVWGTLVMAEVEDIVKRLRFELKKEGIYLLKDMKVSGDNLMVTCINHKEGQENNPSCGIRLHGEAAGVVHCLSCGYRADLPQFVSDAFGKRDGGMFGYRWITKTFVNVAVEQRKDLIIDLSRENKQSESKQSFITEEQLDKYRYIHPYMYKRKLTDSIIDYFDIGYDNTDHSIVFPIHNLQGRVPFLGKRSIKGKYYYFEPDGEQRRYHVYGLYQVMENLEHINRVWLMEGFFDCLTAWTQKIAAVCFMGSKITDEQLDLLKLIPVRDFVLAFDDDEAGHMAAERVVSEVKRIFYQVKYITPGDINDQEVPLSKLPLELY